MQSGVNLNSKLDSDSRMNVYMKCVCVACVSAKHYNPDCDVALVTNIEDKNIPEDIRKIFSRESIKIIHVPFDEFKFSRSMKWDLAFYKLCALSHVLKETSYNNFLYMDSDVYVQGSLAPVWEEVQENILMYDINHGLKVPHYLSFLEEVKKFYPGKKIITQYGGEFFAANRENALRFIETAKEIFAEIDSSGITINSGDEAIISVCADKLKSHIRNSGSYIYRFWTGSYFWLVSTCYRWNAVTVLHLPAEKERGLSRIYDKYIVNGRLPANKQVWRICRISTGRYAGLRLRSRIKLFIKELFFTGNDLWQKH